MGIMLESSLAPKIGAPLYFFAWEPHPGGGSRSINILSGIERVGL
jgi:hypothetical protein